MNKYDQYPFERISPAGLDYKFKSVGPKGDIELIIRFQPTGAFNAYNLAFGTLKDDNSIDDQIKLNNNDRNKILSTVAAAVFEFTSSNQLAYIIIIPSTPSRSRLYRMAITINLCYLTQQLEIWGMKKNGDVEQLQANKNYFLIAIKRKL
jgi:hypothetical protein